MKVVLSPQAGFCPGVRNADKSVFQLINNKKSNERIFTLGNLIHNKIYNQSLEKLGVYTLNFEDIEGTYLSDEKSPMTVVIRTHGIPREQYRSLSKLMEKYSDFNVVDCTCPFVKRIHEIAENNTSSDTAFFLFCDPTHPEAIGIMSYANGEKYAFSSLNDLQNLDLNGKIPILCSQTTQNLVEFEKIKKFFKKVCTNVKIFDTICSVTENRQKNAMEIARSVDVMIVVGSNESSNTRKLYDLCSQICEDTRLIESSSELLADFPDSAKSAGITAYSVRPE